MSLIKDDGFSEYCKRICVVTIWATVFYSTVIQQKFFHIPKGMLLLGAAILFFYILSLSNSIVSLQRIVTDESFFMIIYMLYMVPIGCITSSNIGDHISQCIRSMEYMLIMIIISSLIIETNTESFHSLLLIEALVLALVFLARPVHYAAGRYSLSSEMNPNAIGMAFTSGIWSALYHEQKKKISLVFAFMCVLLFGYSIMLTGSRKALIATALIIVLWIIFCFIPDLNNKNIIQESITIIFIIVTILAIGHFFPNIYADSIISERMGNLLQEISEGNRINMYKDGWTLFKSNPILGIGFQGFKNEYGFYSHATLVEIPVSSGTIGTFLYFIPYYLSIKKCLGVLLVTKQNKNLYSENNTIKHLLILWIVMLFYCTSIIHHYQFESFIIFGIIFGQSTYLEKTIYEKNKLLILSNKKWKYIKV